MLSMWRGVEKLILAESFPARSENGFRGESSKLIVHVRFIKMNVTDALFNQVFTNPMKPVLVFGRENDHRWVIREAFDIERFGRLNHGMARLNGLLGRRQVFTNEDIDESMWFRLNLRVWFWQHDYSLLVKCSGNGQFPYYRVQS